MTPNCVLCKQPVLKTNEEPLYTYLCPDCSTTLYNLVDRKLVGDGIYNRAGEYGGWWSYGKPEMPARLKEHLCPQCGRLHPNIEREAIVQ